MYYCTITIFSWKKQRTNPKKRANLKEVCKDNKIIFLVLEHLENSKAKPRKINKLNKAKGELLEINHI